MSEESSADFEATLKELQEVVDKLEAGDLSLEKQLSEYEKGINLSKKCHTMLKDAQLRIQKLNKDE